MTNCYERFKKIKNINQTNKQKEKFYQVWTFIQKMNQKKKKKKKKSVELYHIPLIINKLYTLLIFTFYINMLFN